MSPGGAEPRASPNPPENVELTPHPKNWRNPPGFSLPGETCRAKGHGDTESSSKAILDSILSPLSRTVKVNY